MDLDTITLTTEAIQQATRLRAENPEWLARPLRLYLEGKGCDGFYYGVSFTEEEPEDVEFPQDEGSGLRLVVDPETLTFVKGSIIEWVDDERGKGFLVENPRHKRFKGKFYLRGFWQKKLKEKTLAHDQIPEPPL